MAQPVPTTLHPEHDGPAARARFTPSVDVKKATLLIRRWVCMDWHSGQVVSVSTSDIGLRTWKLVPQRVQR